MYTWHLFHDCFGRKGFKNVYFEGWHSGPSLMPGSGRGKGPGPRGLAPHLMMDMMMSDYVDE